MIQRLDAAEVNGFSDSMLEAEVETLKILIAVSIVMMSSHYDDIILCVQIAWQRIQEQTSLVNE